MDISELTLEFRRLHEKAKKEPLSDAERRRWEELKRLLSQPQPSKSAP